MTAEGDALKVLRAVDAGATSEDEVWRATGLPMRRVLLIAAAVAALPEEDGGLLCCLDGDPWCLTEIGRGVLRAMGD